MRLRRVCLLASRAVVASFCIRSGVPFPIERVAAHNKITSAPPAVFNSIDSLIRSPLVRAWATVNSTGRASSNPVETTRTVIDFFAIAITSTIDQAPCPLESARPSPIWVRCTRIACPASSPANSYVPPTVVGRSGTKKRVSISVRRHL
jgi:hypothetical protein